MSTASRLPFLIGDESILPGERKTIDLPVGVLYNHTEISMPVHVVHGRREGPVLFACAAVHGDEINGVAIIRRLIQLPDMRRMSGTLLAIPVVNVHGFLNQSRYLPDRRDLNRSFPGSPNGSMTSRLADLFMREIVARSQYGIDLHTGSSNRANLPQVRAQFDDDETVRLARAFGAPVLLDAALREQSLRKVADEAGATVIVYEGGEALRFNEHAVRAGVRGIMGVMRALNMLPPLTKPPKKSVPAHFSRSTTWVRAPHGGILRPLKALGELLSEGDKIALITDPFGEHEVAVFAPTDGIIIGQTTLPLVHEGEALYHVARFADPDKILDAIATMRQDHDQEF